MRHQPIRHVLARWLARGAPLAVVALLAVATLAQTLPPASGTAALGHVITLSQQIGPRAAGTAADTRAADYIAAELRRLGYTVERQSFPFRFFEEVSPPVVSVAVPVVAALRALTFEFSASTPNGGLEAELVAVGLGREEDLRGRRLDGKIALMERGEIFFGVKVAHAAAAGASAVVIYNHQPGPAVLGTLEEPSRIPAVMVSQEDGRRLLQWLAGGPVRLRLVVRTVAEQRTSQNVIGIKLGTRLPQEIVVVGGHADSVRGSPGANDNASGTAAMLEAARLLAEVATARTVHVVAFGAEEVGLVGSRHYTRNRVGTVVGMVNMDMVGRGDGLLIGNSSTNVSLLDVAERVAQRLGIRVRRFRLGDSGSDHFSFEQVGIPTVFLHTGDDDAQHTPNDIADRISPQLLEQAAALAAGIVFEIANPAR